MRPPSVAAECTHGESGCKVRAAQDGLISDSPHAPGLGAWLRFRLFFGFGALGQPGSAVLEFASSQSQPKSQSTSQPILDPLRIFRKQSDASPASVGWALAECVAALESVRAWPTAFCWCGSESTLTGPPKDGSARPSLNGRACCCCCCYRTAAATAASDVATLAPLVFDHPSTFGLILLTPTPPDTLSSSIVSRSFFALSPLESRCCRRPSRSGPRQSTLPELPLHPSPLSRLSFDLLLGQRQQSAFLNFHCTFAKLQRLRLESPR